MTREPSSTRRSRERPASRVDARRRSEIGFAYLQAASLVLAQEDGDEVNHSVVAGLCVLAGIAASDAICAVRHGSISRSESHNNAVAHLRATKHPSSSDWSNALERLLGLKDEAHYGFISVSRTNATAALRQAQLLVDAAGRLLAE